MATTTTSPIFSPAELRSAGPPSLQFLNVLIVDDDRASRDACLDALVHLGCRPTATDSAEQCLLRISSQRIDVVLLGMTLPDCRRLQILRQIKRRQSNIEVIMVSTNSAARPAVEAMKAGAFDYLLKPFDLEELRTVFNRISSAMRSRFENRQLEDQIKATGFGGMIGHAQEMDRLYRMILKAAESAHPVLIQGESGTGKELVARGVHYGGVFRDKPFLPIDCGSLVPSLIESELFGYVKGAFTGASQGKQGLLAIAEGGTVFLDEVGELALELQAKLLRALQEKEIRPVGGTKAVPINVRVLAATNRNLEEAVANGTFRRDLYFRLNVLNLRIPPLRERRQDIPLLATFFLGRIARECGRTYSLSAEAMQALLAYEWPGNVRELENCIERCCAMNSGPVLHGADLPSPVTAAQEPLQRVCETHITRLGDLEKQAILGAISRLNGNKLMAARLLGIGKTTLYRKLKEYENSLTPGKYL